MDESLVPHEIRITQQGKMQSWIEFALSFLQENPDRPITLHTLPAPKPQQQNTSDREQPPPQDEPGTFTKPERERERMPTSMTTIPRLVSVAEIIKREYLKTLSADEAEQNSLTGLHQYNEFGTLPDEANAEPVDAEAERQQSLSNALSGKNHLKMRHVAYMKITLSRKCHPELQGTGASYQQPAVRRLSKAARSRVRRRQKKDPTAPTTEEP
ncbi:hypothetical protein QCA50_007263 [Cerrena zonata]|uniref:Uncharacterized protein n=1 Tax=Cerrena zonata TaxID=2478898 RepID=A0AAW0G9K1_9APHY